MTAKSFKPVFLGYIIASDKEDFLQKYTFAVGYQNAVWTMFPDLAQRFKTVEEASAVIGFMDFSYPVFILEIHDLGKQVGLLPVDSFPCPDWMPLS